MNASQRFTSGEGGDERRARFDALYAEHQRSILGYVLRRAENAEDAADALAETFLIAWRRMDEMPADDRRGLWLYGVARRVLANQRRGERRRLALTQRLSTELMQLPARPAPTGVLVGLGDAFKRLSEADREILALEGWEGLEPAQIATVLGCSRNAARIRLHRARRRLAEHLALEETGVNTTEAQLLSGEAT
jgi:RNA polymerase sigma-70 factor (ECF subfamily)